MLYAFAEMFSATAENIFATAKNISAAAENISAFAEKVSASAKSISALAEMLFAHEREFIRSPNFGLPQIQAKRGFCSNIAAIEPGAIAKTPRFRGRFAN
jgi:hypothetical protein